MMGRIAAGKLLNDRPWLSFYGPIMVHESISCNEPLMPHFHGPDSQTSLLMLQNWLSELPRIPFVNHKRPRFHFHLRRLIAMIAHH